VWPMRGTRFGRTILELLAGAARSSVHRVAVQELEIARPFVREQLRVRFHIIQNPPKSDTQRSWDDLDALTATLYSQGRVTLETGWPGPTHYFTFSSRYSPTISREVFREAVARAFEKDQVLRERGQGWVSTASSGAAPPEVPLV
jgi:hypothetical protein